MTANVATPDPGSLGLVPLDGAGLLFAPAWLDAAASDALMEALLAQVPWEVHRIRLFGRELASPRLSCWIGDPGTAYRYSGALFEPQGWPAALASLRGRLERDCGVRFNSVLANRYRDGRDAMGWHSDDERELGVQPVIASLSLGATRRFALKSRVPGGPKLALDLPHGSLLLMRGDTQRNFRHALPRTARPVGQRINLTFRSILRTDAIASR
jgi:alkylated DNA repair dioxygenase AlkB